MQKYTIDPEYKALLPPQTEDERKALEESILADGCRDALIVDETNTIIDGHNRYEICTKHNIPFNVVIRHFDSRDDIIVFICRNQIGRRNLSPDTLSYVIGLMYNLEKKKRGAETGGRGNQHTKLVNGKNCQLPRNTYTSEKIAKIAGVSEKSVRNAGQFASAVDTLSENEPSVKAAILSGKSGLTRKSVVEIAAMDDEKKKAAVDKIKAGEGRKVVDEMKPAKRMCAKCGIEKDESEFNRNSSICIKCVTKKAEISRIIDYSGDIKEQLENIALAEKINEEMRIEKRDCDITIDDVIEKINIAIESLTDQIFEIKESYTEIIKKNPKKIKTALLATEAAMKRIRRCFYA